jgi:hypothetical protein
MTTRKTSIVVAVCLVLVGTLTVTTGVTAAPTDNSAVQRFNIEIGDYKYGELAVDTDSATRYRKKRVCVKSHIV